MYPPTQRHRGRRPAAKIQQQQQKKQLTCYNLHVVFCFCPGSFCKTRPFLHCSGPAVVLRGQKTQQTPLYSHQDTFPLKITSCYVISSVNSGVELSVLRLHLKLAQRLWIHLQFRVYFILFNLLLLLLRRVFSVCLISVEELHVLTLLITHSQAFCVQLWKDESIFFLQRE